MATKPDELPDDVETLKALILAARAETSRMEAERVSLSRETALLRQEVDRLTAQTERLDHIIAVLRRAQFGRSSERISDEQLKLALEDVETAHAVEDAKAETANDIARREGIKTRCTNRGALPKHLPREEIVIELESTICPCCGGTLHAIGEDVSERLDKVPAKLKVIVTRRPKYACRACEKTGADNVTGVIQAPAPLRLVEGGLPTEALVADVLVSKYADHLPLYRQAQILAREGVVLDRSTLAHWVGFAAFELQPLHARLVEILKSSTKLFADETRCPVLDPGRGRTKTGYLWALARDNRPWAGCDPPAVAYLYAPGRGAEHAVRQLESFSGILQVDGYAAYKALTNRPRAGGPVTLAFCWSHFRRKFYEIAKAPATRRSRRKPCSASALCTRSRLTSVAAAPTNAAPSGRHDHSRSSMR